MNENTHKVPKNANLKDFINLERYFRKKPAIFNKYYETNLLDIIDILPPINEEQRQKYAIENNVNLMKKKKVVKNQEDQKIYEQDLLKNVTIAYHHQTDRLNQDLEINQYTFTGLLGRGAHSLVRSCKSNQKDNLGNQYACKILCFDKIRKKYFIKPRQLYEMVNNEIILLKQMKHPNIISIKQAIYLKQKQRMFLIIQYCSKGTIIKLVNNNLTIQDKQWWIIVKRYFTQLVSAIKYMHEHNFIHRDIKPQNLLINDHNVLKIIDFNVSFKLQNSEKIKITNKFIGTKGYAAPQLILNLDKQKLVDGKKIDVWAMGIALIQILQRRHPYPVKTLPQLIKVLQNYKNLNSKEKKQEKIHSNDKKEQNQIVNQKLQINQEYPLQLQDLLSKMLQYQNQKRITVQQISNHSWLKN